MPSGGLSRKRDAYACACAGIIASGGGRGRQRAWSASSHVRARDRELCLSAAWLADAEWGNREEAQQRAEITRGRIWTLWWVAGLRCDVTSHVRLEAR